MDGIVKWFLVLRLVGLEHSDLAPLLEEHKDAPDPGNDDNDHDGHFVLAHLQSFHHLVGVRVYWTIDELAVRASGLCKVKSNAMSRGLAQSGHNSPLSGDMNWTRRLWLACPDSASAVMTSEYSVPDCSWSRVKFLK